MANKEHLAYLPVPSASVSDDGIYIPAHKRQTSNWNKIWRLAILFLLATANLLLVVGFYQMRTTVKGDHDAAPEDFALIDEIPTIYKRFNWWTEYSDKNTTAVDEMWEEINPAHGFIATDRTWALQNHWPESMQLPSDNNKNVYLLESYHMIHCLYVIRKTFWEAVNRQEYTWNPPHSGHCFDALRQFIVCKADNTPLYTFGRNTAGDQQYRKCRDWNVLRDYATKHTACYRDFPKNLTKEDRAHFALRDHFGYCDDGSDGMVIEASRKMHELSLEEFEAAASHGLHEHDD